MSARILFVTGTDTAVGKTTCACALAAAFRQAGRRVAVLKPIETGCPPDPGGPEGALLPRDALALAAAAGQAAGGALDLDRLCPYRLRLPASPEAAARAEGRRIDLDHLSAVVESLRPGADLLLVEGAGGLLVPIDEHRTMADLALRLAARLLVVARTSLGTLNHTLLTLEAARHRGLHVAGVILSQQQPPVPDDPSTAATAEAIARHGQTIVHGTLPYLSFLTNDEDRDATWRTREAARAENLAAIARAHLDLEGLWRAI